MWFLIEVASFSLMLQAYDPDSEEMLMLFQEGVSSLGLACYVPGSLTSLLLIAAGNEC